MLITVVEALQKGFFKEAKVVAGHSGLQNTITTAEVMETPKIVDRMQGGEFILGSGYSFHDNPVLQVELVKRFAQKNISAFGIQVGRYMASIPEVMRRCADVYGLPLLELPANYSYMDFAMPFYEMVINCGMELLRYSDEVHYELIETVLNGNSANGILTVCLERLNRPLLLMDRFGIVLNYREMEHTPASMQSWAKALYQRINYRRQSIAILSVEKHEQPFMAAVAALEAQGELAGFFAVLEVGEALNDKEQVVLKEASQLLALELMKERAVLTANRSAKSDLFEDLIGHSYRNAQAMIRRGNFFSINLQANLKVVCIVLKDAVMQMSTEECQKKYAQQFAALVDVVYEEFNYSPFDVIAMQDGYGVACLLAFDMETAGGKLQGKLQGLLYRSSRSELLRQQQLVIRQGKTVMGIDAVAQSYKSAQDCMKIAAYFDRWGEIVDYQDVRIYTLILEFSQLNEARSFYKRYMAGILRYDAEHDGSLIGTLRAYFMHQRNLTKTAQSLFLHKNTVSYRLKRAEEVSGIHLDRHGESLLLEICVLMHGLGLEKEG